MDLPPATAETLRFVALFALLAVAGTVERARPRRLSDPQRPLRWPANFGLGALGAGLVLALQFSTTAIAVWAAREHFGLFNRVAVPAPVAFVGSWLFLDLAVYILHRAFHHLRWLWPLHRVHHSDVEFDATTGLRFHPGEVLLTQGYKSLVVIALGAPWAAVLTFEIALSAFLVFTHANVRVSEPVERFLRVLLVTPDLHRVHHSPLPDEHERNYGMLLGVWDRAFRTFRAEPRTPPREMTIGLPQFRHPPHQHLVALLKQPLDP